MPGPPVGGIPSDTSKRQHSLRTATAKDVRNTSMGLVRESRRDSNLGSMNRIQPTTSIAVCLMALAHCGTSFAADTATTARPGSLSQERLNSAPQDSADFLITHGNYAQTRYHPADRINTQTVRD